VSTPGFHRAAGIVLLGILSGAAAPAAALPRPDHVVIVIEENRSLSSVIGNESAPYINSLAARGALFTNFHALVHPSQPNYLALFSGSLHDVRNDVAPPAGSPYASPNLASGLFGAGLSFAGYSEDLPFAGFTGVSHEHYQRRHNPWVNFTNVPASSNLPFTDFPSPDRFDALPTISIVIPNLLHDMHSASTAAGDAWLKEHLDAYVRWAETHNSLFILTWDESNHVESNHIPTLFVGPMVRAGTYDPPLNHLHLLRTLEDLYGLAYAGDSANVAPITAVWVESATPDPSPDPEPSPAPAKDSSKKCGALGVGALLLALLAGRLVRRK
jgi:acid phosphatase